MSPEVSDMEKTEITPTDLYSLIHPVKEAQFKRYGKHSNWDYKVKMQHLKEGKPQIRLQNERLAREIVRVLLMSNGAIGLEGKGTIIVPEYYAYFHSINDTQVTEMAYALMNEDGLLDFCFGGCGPNRWAFESEIIDRPWKANPSYLQSTYSPNTKLRNALSNMLKRFESEKPLYVVKGWNSMLNI